MESAPISDGRDRLILLRVSSFPEYRDQKTQFTGRVLKIYEEQGVLYLPLNLSINLNGNINITPGQCLLARLKCKEPGEYLTPGVPSFRKRLAIQGIGVVCNGTPNLMITGIQNCDRFYTLPVKRLRDSIENIINRNFTEPISNFLTAITIGKMGRIPEGILNDFRISGTAHLLAISGLHVGIVAGFFYFLFRFILKLNTRVILKYNIRRLSAIFTIPFVVSFAIIAGMSPSTVRATFMTTLFLLSLAALRPPNIMYIACAVWVLLLLVDPTSLFDLSFELSFGALFSILLYAKHLLKISDINLKYGLLKRIYQFVTGNLFVSLAGFLGTSILIAKNFKSIPLYFLPANIIAVPLTGLITPLLVLYILLSFLQLDVFILKMAIIYLTEILFRSNNFWATLPSAKINCTPPDDLTCLLYYTLLLLLSPISARWIKIPLLTLFLLCFSPLPKEITQAKETELRVTFIDVGQGDATLLEFPRGKKILVDCGPRREDFDAGERVVAPFLWNKGIEKINVIAITHQQMDHAGGCNYIIEHFNVDEVWTSDTNWDVSGIPIRHKRIKVGTVYEENGIKVISINPGMDRKPENNNNSLVLKIIYSRYSFLLSADIEKIAEEKLYGNLKSTVLKVPHHGSCTSSTNNFLARVSPEIAIISAGRQNPFHHPCPQVITRIKKYTDRIFVTADQGTVSIATDGNVLCYSTYYDKGKHPRFRDMDNRSCTGYP